LSSGTFAISYTVKNESRLLPSGIDYHLAAGCTRIYLFWDNTTDNAPDLVASYPQVIARKSYRPDELPHPPDWLAAILPWWDVDLDVRKIANTYYATLDAAKDGIEWLVSIDADELILMDRAGQNLENHIPRFLERVPAQIDQLLLPNVEAVPGAAETENPFIDWVYFLNRFPASEFLWRYSRAALVRITRSPKLIAWYDWLFYEILFAGAMRRMMRDPATNQRIPGTYFLAYVSNKAFIRTRVAPDLDFATHGWKRFRRKPRNLRVGNVLHYDMLDAAYFAAKFRQRPPERGLFYFRTQLSIVARERTLEQIRQFFETYIVIRDPRRIARLKRKGILLEIRSIADLLNKLSTKKAAADT